jgi:hypothetical protein
MRGKKMIKSSLVIIASIFAIFTTHYVLGKLDIVGETTSWFNDDTFNIVGEIKNNGTHDVDFVKVIASLYNADGAVIGSDFIYTDPSTIEAGDTCNTSRV